jgi:nitrite reductase/ring-hydroxylating ferredoxin subunit
MDRKEFIKKCGFACLAATGIGAVLQSCVASRSVIAEISGSDLVFAESHFETVKHNKIRYKKYLVVQNERLKFPICIFRHPDNTYSAVLMKCSHQGAELQVFGDKLQCPAHGSEFNQHGKPLNAPADTNLRSFVVVQENKQIKISLK